MADSLKRMSDRDAPQVHKLTFNEEDKSISTAGFLVGKVNREVLPVISTTTVPNDTVTYTYQEDSLVLYVIRCIYTDGTRANLISAKRIT
jgi:hypothetical protein